MTQEIPSASEKSPIGHTVRVRERRRKPSEHRPCTRASLPNETMHLHPSCSQSNLCLNSPYYKQFNKPVSAGGTAAGASSNKHSSAGTTGLGNYNGISSIGGGALFAGGGGSGPGHGLGEEVLVSDFNKHYPIDFSNPNTNQFNSLTVFFFSQPFFRDDRTSVQCPSPATSIIPQTTYHGGSCSSVEPS